MVLQFPTPRKSSYYANRGLVRSGEEGEGEEEEEEEEVSLNFPSAEGPFALLTSH